MSVSNCAGITEVTIKGVVHARSRQPVYVTLHIIQVLTGARKDVDPASEVFTRLSLTIVTCPNIKVMTS